MEKVKCFYSSFFGRVCGREEETLNSSVYCISESEKQEQEFDVP